MSTRSISGSSATTALEAALRGAVAAQADAVITSGGVSVGEADFTRDVMARLGDVTFASVALRPGRPLACGTLARAADGAGHCSSACPATRSRLP